MNPQRHHLIYLDPQAEFTIASVHQESHLIAELVRGWLAKELPCIYSRQYEHEASNLLALGLTLWVVNKKQRVALQVSPAAIKKQQPPPQLIDMHVFFSKNYGVFDLCSTLELSPVTDIAVYGSFLYHYFSGHSLVTETSDLDLLLHYQGYSLGDLQTLINRLTQKFNRTIDGELRFPDFGDISIKELLNLSAQNMLCKSTGQVRLISRTELYEHYPML